MDNNEAKAANLFQRIGRGAVQGLRSGNTSLLGIFAIAIALPILPLVLLIVSTGMPFSWHMVSSVGPQICFTAAFGVYIVCVKCLQLHWLAEGNEKAVVRLVKQADVAVMFALATLICILTLQ